MKRVLISTLVLLKSTIILLAQTASPNTGPTIGGTTINVTLANTGQLNNTDFVLFNGVSVSFTKPGGNVVRLTSLAGTGSSVTIEGRKTSVTGTQAWSAIFSYDAPTLTLMNPSNGPTNQTTAVVVTGTNFGPSGKVSGVTVDGIAATNVSNTQTSVSFTVPAHADGAVPVVITIAPESPATGIRQLTINSFTYSSALSVELKEFKGINLDNKSNKLSWALSDDNEVSKISVERSIDNLSFTTIQNIEPNSSVDGAYDFIDNSPSPMNYYRLKIYENNESVHYSKIISISLGFSKKYVKIYPNPVSTEGVINIEKPNEDDEVLIINMLGQVILTSQMSRINISTLDKGAYNIIVKTANEVLTQKLFVN